MEEDMKIVFDIDSYKDHEAWSKNLAEDYGVKVAASFAVGSDIFLDTIEEGLVALSALPKGSHIGQVEDTLLRGDLPPQFMMRYDYDFLYLLKTRVIRYRKIAKSGLEITADSILDKLVLYLIMEYSLDLMEEMVFPAVVTENEYDVYDEWAFTINGDMDIETCLYSDLYLDEDNIYHFKHWSE